MRYTTGAGLSAAENRKQLWECIDAYSKTDNQFRLWAVLRKSDLQFVGTCAIVQNQKSEDEVGYRLLRRFWSLGYGQEICDALIDHVINNMGLDRVVAYVDLRNLASIRILDRSTLDFVEELKTDDGGADRFYCWTRK